MKRSTLGIIPCTKEKIWDIFPDMGSVLAENVYINPFHSLARTYIDFFTNHCVIFSAKYGFLRPHDLVPGFYDVTFDRPNDPYISVEMLKKQSLEKRLNNYRKIIAVCNSRYIAMIKKTFSKKTTIEIPFEGIEDNAEGIMLLNSNIKKIFEL
jgi:hypothetical protein